MIAVLGCTGLKFVRARRHSRNTTSMKNPLTNISPPPGKYRTNPRTNPIGHTASKTKPRRRAGR
jgi:hypothetical protein